MVSRWARTGQLRVNGKRATPGDRIEAGQTSEFPPADATPARTGRPERKREPLTAEEEELVREMVIYEDAHAFVLNKPPGLATQGGTKTHQHLDRLLDGLPTTAGAGPSSSTGSTRTRPARCWSLGPRASAGHFAKSFSGRTARKVYWALVVGVPSPDEGLIDAPLAKQPGTGGEKMHVDEEKGSPPRPATG